MPFRSGPVHASTEADVIAVHCSDPRYQPHFQQFLNTALGLGRYGLIAVPGGPQFLTSAGDVPEYSSAGWRWLEFLVALAHPRRIVLVAHDDCRWYHGVLKPGEAGPPRQADDLRRVRSMLQERFGGVHVELYFARLEGHEAVFEDVQ